MGVRGWVFWGWGGCVVFFGGPPLTCSNSSVMVLGSSWRWNHIMYLVWKRHDCFFRALAARYCALVPWGGGEKTHKISRGGAPPNL